MTANRTINSPSRRHPEGAVPVTASRGAVAPGGQGGCGGSSAPAGSLWRELSCASLTQQWRLGLGGGTGCNSRAGSPGAVGKRQQKPHSCSQGVSQQAGVWAGVQRQSPRKRQKAAAAGPLQQLLHAVLGEWGGTGVLVFSPEQMAKVLSREAGCQ